MGPDLVRMAMAAGDRQRAVAVTEELERSAPRCGSPTARGIALRCRGLLDDDPDALLEAVAAHRGGPRPYPLAAACEDAGVALGRIGKTGEAVPLLNEAVAVYERLDAVRDVDRVQPALRSLGVRRPRRAARRPAFGWDSLTPSELQVVDLAVTGLTNREIAERLFVSRRTVATHLEHVFQKLGHGNRVELTADAARRAATPLSASSNSDSTRSSPSQPTNTTSTPPARLTRPIGGSIPSSRMVISTTGSCPRPSAGRIGQPTDLGSHLGQVTDVCEPATAHAGGAPARGRNRDE